MSGFRMLRIVLALTALALALGAASSPARLIRFSNRTIRATYTQVRITNLFTSVECPVTLEGSFHAMEVGKSEGNLIGYITRALAAPSPCTRGTITFLELPWHVKFERFSGTLPNITSIFMRLINFSVNTNREMMINCLYRSTEAEPLVITFVREAAGAITSARFIETILIRRANGSGFCGPEAEVVGSGSVTVLNSATRITITLI